MPSAAPHHLNRNFDIISIVTLLLIPPLNWRDYVKAIEEVSQNSRNIGILAELFWSLFRSGPVVHHAHQFDLNVALQTLISIAFAADCSSHTQLKVT
ncbi:DNA polymerase [Trichinella spiralis]|uniref:DNA polymerase n=1 Tax=Trichinella spiralis TaxID=6334 RepID=A0ABR3L1G6_TRISP